MDWMLRSHGVSYKHEEEEEVKARIQKRDDSLRRQPSKFESEKILLFMTITEALEFCESALIHQFPRHKGDSPTAGLLAGPQPLTLSGAFARVLDCTEEECLDLSRLDSLQYHDEIAFNAGERILSKGAYPDGFYVVLSGTVASEVGGGSGRETTIMTGAGLFRQRRGSKSNLLDPEFLETGGSDRMTTLWPVCSVFGYCDFLLERPYTFGALAAQNGTRVARMGRSQLHLLANDPALSALVHRFLLQASIRDLQNCTCRDV